MNATKKMLAPRCEAGVTSEKQVQHTVKNYSTAKIGFNENPQQHNLQAETGLIENLSFRPENSEKVELAVSIAAPSDFYSRLRANVYQRIIEFYEAERVWNLTTLADSFKGDSGFLKYRDFFDDLRPFTGELVGHNAKLIKDCSNGRKMISATYQAYLDLHNGSGVVDVCASLNRVLWEVM